MDEGRLVQVVPRPHRQPPRGLTARRAERSSDRLMTRTAIGLGAAHTRPTVLRVLTPDGWLLFLTRFTRLFAYGALAVVLVFYLTSLGLSTSQTGMLLTLTLAGDIVVSLYLTTPSDRIRRRRMPIIGAALMAAAGVAFASTSNLVFLVVAGTIGVIRPSRSGVL